MGLRVAGAARALRGGFFGTGFHVAAFSDADTELSGNGYARIPQTDIANWQAVAADGWHRNIDALEFPMPSGALLAPTHGALYDAATGGNLLWTQDLAGDPDAPQLGASFGWNANALRIRFNSGQSFITPSGSIASFTEGLVGGSGSTRFVSLHSAAPGANGANQAGASLEVAYEAWGEVPGAANSIRNLVPFDFGLQSDNLPDITYAALRSTAAGNAPVYWSAALANDPDDPDIGDRITIPTGGMTLTLNID